MAAMTTVGFATFQARLKAMVDSQNHMKQLLEAERVTCIAIRREHRERQSSAREFQQTGLKFCVKAEEITLEIKAIDDQRDDTTLALNVLESKTRSLNEELFELQRTRDGNRKFYDCKGTEIRNFKLKLRDCESTTKTEDAEPADELKCDVKKERQFATASDGDAEDDTDINEGERTRLMSAKEAISREVCSNHKIVGILEQRLHEALQRSGTTKRDLAAAVDTLRADITTLQTTERNQEDQVLRAITRRDKRKRELHDVECKLDQKRRLFYGGDKSQNNIGERWDTCGRSQEKTVATQ